MFHKIKEILKDVNLLIVEDDDELLQTLVESLLNYVKNIFTYSNAKEALDDFLNLDINLILSDINLPKMSGLEMAKHIRKSDANVPIIFLTAFDSDENMLSAIDVKSSAFLKKPFNKRDLVMNMSFAVNKFKGDFANIDLKNGFIFNAFTKELTNNGLSVALTKKEQNLLQLLLKNIDKTVSFTMIEDYVWYGEGCSGDMIRSFIYKLRKKIYPELIQNCQGNGYKLSLSEENQRTRNGIKCI